jgi:antitoxin component YwqK of YwqJK toxin-antitoxin module
MKKGILLIIILSAFACNNTPEKPIVESGIALPENVVEMVEERYQSPKAEEKGSLKKAVYIDTTTKAKVAERYFYKTKKVYTEYAFQNGRKNGTAMAFREANGAPWSLNTYLNDTLHGPYKTWHENGLLMQEGQYDHGIKTGNWRFFNKKGELEKQVNFSDTLSTSVN